jgi:hypothetical protein
MKVEGVSKEKLCNIIIMTEFNRDRNSSYSEGCAGVQRCSFSIKWPDTLTDYSIKNENAKFTTVLNPAYLHTNKVIPHRKLRTCQLVCACPCQKRATQDEVNSPTRTYI